MYWKTLTLFVCGCSGATDVADEAKACTTQSFDSGLNISAGGLRVEAGGITANSGGLRVNAGGLYVNDGGAVYRSTAGPALDIHGTAFLSTTAESSAALQVKALSKHYGGPLIELRSETVLEDTDLLFLDALLHNESVFSVSGSGGVRIESVESSTSDSTGALVVGGGIAAKGNAHIGGQLYVHNSRPTIPSKDGNPDEMNTKYDPPALHVAGAMLVEKTATFTASIAVGQGGVNATESISIRDLRVAETARPSLTFQRGRQLEDSLYTVAKNDILGSIEFQGYSDEVDNTGFWPMAGLESHAEGEDSARLIFRTSASSRLMETAMVLTGQGNAEMQANATVRGTLFVQDRTESSSPVTGAAVLKGGVGIGRSLSVGGRVTIADLSEASDDHVEAAALLVAGGVSVGKGMRVEGPVRVLDDTASESPTTGALTVDGGLGIREDIQVGGRIIIDDDTNTNGVSTGSLVTFGGIGVGGNAAIGGMAMVDGGAIIDGDVRVHSSMYVGPADDDDDDEAKADPLKVLGLPSDPMLAVVGDAGVTGAVAVGGTLVVHGTKESKSSSSGAAILAGGVGVGKNIHVGGSATVEQELFVKQTIHALGGLKYYSHDGENYLGGGQTLHTGGKLVVDTVEGDEASLEVAGAAHLSDKLTIDAALAVGGPTKLSGVTVQADTESNATGVGALVVKGGASIGKSLNVDGVFRVNNDTESRSVETGSIVTQGGLGVGKNMYIQGDVHLYGTMYGWSGLTGVFPDYVFDEDYELMALDELELYVRRERHLPNVTSAAEVKEKGVDLTKLPQVLLEKVEELTLHVLSLHREQNHHTELIAKKDTQINELRADLSAMQERMERLESLITSRDRL